MPANSRLAQVQSNALPGTRYDPPPKDDMKPAKALPKARAISISSDADMKAATPYVAPPEPEPEKIMPKTAPTDRASQNSSSIPGYGDANQVSSNFSHSPSIK